MVSDRSTVVVYTTGVCNLNCTYCYIDKNPALREIDRILEESFKGDYYINFIKEMFPDRNQLKCLETWGGEPFLGMNRVYNLIQQLIDYYPNFNSFFSSTNLSTENWIEEFSGLINVFGNNKHRDFSISLQVSIDGPEYINDKNRGVGTTKKIEKNFGKLVEFCKSVPSNVTLRIQHKPTFDIECIKMLSSEEKIIEYYRYLESYVEKINDLGLSNVEMMATLPNTACPSPHTKGDGIIMRDFCKLTRKVEKYDMFKYYKDLTLYSKGYCCSEKSSYRCTSFTCGTGFTTLGVLPYDMVSTCHNGFVDLISDYKRLCNSGERKSVLDFKFFLDTTKSRFCISKEEYKMFESQMKHYNVPNTTSRMTNTCTTIVGLALVGQIDKKYLDYEEALKGAQFLRDRTSFCIRDNYSITGSITLQPYGLYKLLLNGAREVIDGE